MYFDLYPLEMIKKQNKTKTKQKNTDLWTAFYVANHPDRNDHHITLIYTYRLNTYQNFSFCI